MVDRTYVLVRVLARGGTAAVWVAQHMGSGKQFALKMLRDPTGIVHVTERVAREAKSLAKIQHPNVVRVVEFGVTRWADPYLVMELLIGPTIQDLLARGGRLPATDAVQLLLPIADALVATHAAGILHRDLKPENVVCVRHPLGYLQPKIIDFGIAAGIGPGVGRITQMGIVLGSPEYLSPERARGAADADGRSDLWSFCVMLYELVAGRTPFYDPSDATLVLKAVLERAVPPLGVFGIEEPELGAILARGLQKMPAGRWPDMRSLGKALAAWLVSKGVYEDVEGNSLQTTWLSTPASLAPVAMDTEPEPESVPVFPKNYEPYQLPKTSWAAAAMGLGGAAMAFGLIALAAIHNTGDWKTGGTSAGAPAPGAEPWKGEPGTDLAPLAAEEVVDAGLDAAVSEESEEFGVRSPDIRTPTHRYRWVPPPPAEDVPTDEPFDESESTSLPIPEPPPTFE